MKDCLNGFVKGEQISYFFLSFFCRIESIGGVCLHDIYTHRRVHQLLTRRPRTTILSERLRPRVAAITRLVSQHLSDTSAPLSPPGHPRHAPHLRGRRAGGWALAPGAPAGTGSGDKRVEVVVSVVCVRCIRSSICNGRVGGLRVVVDSLVSWRREIEGWKREGEAQRNIRK